MPKLLRFDHVQLAMPAGREADAVAFYVGLFGLSDEPKPPALAVRGGCWFRADGLAVHLGVDPTFRPATKAHPAFVVDDLDELAARLEAAGWPVRFDEALEGVKRAYVDDPFGNRIELVQDAPTPAVR